MGAMDEVFGHREHRPDHPDLWRISEILLANDGAIEAAGVDAEEVWKGIVAQVGDRESIVYMAAMRTVKLLGPPTPENIALRSTITALAIDAFLAGAMFEQRGGHRDADGTPTSQDERASAELTRQVHAELGRLFEVELDPLGVLYIYVTDDLSVTTGLHGWHYGTVNLLRNGVWETTQETADPADLSEDEWDPAIIALRWTRWVLERRALL